MSEQKEITVTASGPYPEPVVTHPNPRYARLLLQDMAGMKGEMTAIYQYLYEDWTLDAAYTLIAQTMLRIAKVEMYHLDILGRLIVMLGVSPRCRSIPNNPRSAWNGNMIRCQQNIRQRLTYNIMLEEASIKAYTTHAKMIQDGNIPDILNRLAQDEKVHLEILKQFLSELDKSE